MDLTQQNQQYIRTLNETQLRDYFKENLDCPLPIRENQRYHILRDQLLWSWRKTCKTYEIDCETKYIFDDDDERDFELDEDDYEELKPIAISLSSWIDKAREEFLDTIKPITSIMADSEIYKKHIPNRTMSLVDLKKLAIRDKAGYFYQNIKIEDLDRILLQSMETFFPEILKEETIRYALKCKNKMGVTDKGDETEYILIEINRSSTTSHAYPCSEEKAKSMKTLQRKMSDEINEEYYSEPFNKNELRDIYLYTEL